MPLLLFLSQLGRVVVSVSVGVLVMVFLMYGMYFRFWDIFVYTIKIHKYTEI